MSFQPPGMPQMGGIRAGVVEEATQMINALILIGLSLVVVYVNRIPTVWLSRFRTVPYQLGGLFLVFSLLLTYGWVHGILAGLAFALVVSRALRAGRFGEGFESIEDLATPTLAITSDSIQPIPSNHRWFVEKVMGENPFLLREEKIKTAPVQDSSERNMGSS